MKKKIIIILLILAALSSILFINLENKSTAQECNDCTTIPTPPGNSDYSKMNCNCENPTEGLFTFDDDSTPDTIVKNSSIQVHVTGGCPPFTFATSSTGYTFNGGVQSYETNSRMATLSCVSGTCGVNYAVVASVTVIDDCSSTINADIRNTSGKWTTSSVRLCTSGMSLHWATALGGVIPGKYRYSVNFYLWPYWPIPESLCRNAANQSLCSQSCAAMILDGTRGFDEFVKLADASQINSEPTAQVPIFCATCLGVDGVSRQEIAMKMSNDANGTGLITNYALNQHEWICQ